MKRIGADGDAAANSVQRIGAPLQKKNGVKNSMTAMKTYEHDCNTFGASYYLFFTSNCSIIHMKLHTIILR